MRSMRLVLGVLAAVVASGCAPAVSGGPSVRVPGDERPNRLPRPATTVGTPSGGSSTTMRYACRGKSVSGWIAIDYIEDREACTTNSLRYGTAVLVPLSNTAVGQLLEVCADERLPRNWSLVRTVPGDARCPSAKPSPTPGEATVREIRRDR
jgi:hypothetical protein